jgi:hypothetical protein
MQMLSKSLSRQSSSLGYEETILGVCEETILGVCEETILDVCEETIGRHDWFYYTSTKCAIPDDIWQDSNYTWCM